MLVTASTDCFADLSLSDAISRIVDLEYTNVEIVFREGGPQLQASQLLDDFDGVLSACRSAHRLNLVAYRAELDPADTAYYDKFQAVCRLAKTTKVVQVTVQSGEIGTPFNEEVERLRELVKLAALEGARVGIHTQVGRLSEDPDTVVVLCDNVKGLGVSLDPSHFICNPRGSVNYDKLIKYVYHVYLRDSARNEFQVRVGQGEIEYGRLVSQLRAVHYTRCLSVDIRPDAEMDHDVEMRKMRLLLESLL